MLVIIFCLITVSCSWHSKASNTLEVEYVNTYILLKHNEEVGDQPTEPPLKKARVHDDLEQQFVHHDDHVSPQPTYIATAAPLSISSNDISTLYKIILSN